MILITSKCQSHLQIRSICTCTELSVLMWLGNLMSELESHSNRCGIIWDGKRFTLVTPKRNKSFLLYYFCVIFKWQTMNTYQKGWLRTVVNERQIAGVLIISPNVHSVLQTLCYCLGTFSNMDIHYLPGKVPLLEHYRNLK